MCSLHCLLRSPIFTNLSRILAILPFPFPPLYKPAPAPFPHANSHNSITVHPAMMWKTQEPSFLLPSTDKSNLLASPMGCAFGIDAMHTLAVYLLTPYCFSQNNHLFPGHLLRTPDVLRVCLGSSWKSPWTLKPEQFSKTINESSLFPCFKHHIVFSLGLK